MIEGGEREHSSVEVAVADAMKIFPRQAGEAEWNLSLSLGEKRCGP